MLSSVIAKILPQLRAMPFVDLALTVGITAILSIIFRFVIDCRKRAQLPLINSFPFFKYKAKTRFVKRADELLRYGFSKSENAFRMVTDLGTDIVLAPKYAAELKNHDGASFSLQIMKDFFGHLPGFEPMGKAALNNVTADVVRTKLQSPGAFNEPLSDETNKALKDIWTDNPEWKEICLKDTILDIVARVSSRTFLGPEFCQNPKWLEISVDHTVNLFNAADSLRLWPRFLVPIVHWFIPECRKIRARVKEARQIIEPMIEKRRADKASGVQREDGTKNSDSLLWAEEVANGRSYDAVIVQLSLALAAIHTTSDLLTQAIYDLCQHRDLIEPLQEEARSAMAAGDGKKPEISRLKLLDSFIKESQRMIPNLVNMRRCAIEDITLSDGILIPKGSAISVSTSLMRDPAVYENPEQFDGYRFLKMAQKAGTQVGYTFTSTSAEHLAFGYGKHACPGRFFAANEIKIILCQLLLKYDWKFIKGSEPKAWKHGYRANADPTGKIMIRRLQES